MQAILLYRQQHLSIFFQNLSLSGERPSKKEAWAIQNQGSEIKNDSKKDADTCTNQSPATTILEDSQSEDLPNEDFKKHAWEISATNEKRLVNVVNDNSLFDIVILKNLPSVQEINAKNEYLYVRPLQGDDFHRGYIDLLKQLTSVGNVSESDFTGNFTGKKLMKLIYISQGFGWFFCLEGSKGYCSAICES